MKKIGVVTTSRADYGILEPLLKRIEQDSDLELQLFVSGSHYQGSFKNVYLIPIDTSSTDSSGVAKALAQTQIEFEKILSKQLPDLLIVLGDRVEMLPIAMSASLLHIPIAHIHGGELTLGAIDESVRHSLTKFSHLHFTSCEEYKKRVIQLGEFPDRVFNVGSIALEEIVKTNHLSKSELQKELDVQLGEKNLVVTLHPETLENQEYQGEMVDNLLSALDKLPKSHFTLFTATNADLYGKIINEKIKKFVSLHPNTKFVESLGAQKYYSVLKNFDACVGNSSSGIIEAPSLGIPTLNLGQRQAGRVRAKSIVDVSIHTNEIQAGLLEVLSKKPSNIENPYYKKGTVDLIIGELKKVNFKSLLKKSFFDVNMDGQS